MAGGIFAILDDIAILLDDIAVMSKLAAKKTAGILGDDLAVNAEKATGFRASRELPVLWAITKGSLVNKLLILPVAFILSAFAPLLIIPILLVGGAYLCYEGIEKVYHTLTHSSPTRPPAEIVTDTAQLLKIETKKIQSAVRTDFILSIEIIIIALGTVMEQPLMIQVIVVSLVSLLATIGVYGLVALLVRLDDAGLYFIRQAEQMKGIFARMISLMGSILVASLPHIIRALGIIGTVAMLLVGGGIFNHNIKILHHAIEVMPSFFANLFTGFIVGGIILVGQKTVSAIVSKKNRTSHIEK